MILSKPKKSNDLFIVYHLDFIDNANDISYAK